MIKINGKMIEQDTINLMEYLSWQGYDISCIAIECNGQILPKSQYDTKTLVDGDSIEIVSFVGGG